MSGVSGGAFLVTSLRWITGRECVKAVMCGHWSSLYHRVTAGRIERVWRNPFAGSPVAEATVHVLVGGDRLPMCLWMLASWFHVTGRNWRVVLHDDGTLPMDAGKRIDSLGLDCRLIRRHEADASMASALAGLPLCLEHRRRSPLALKLYDVRLLADAERYILLDTDLFFFQRPDLVLPWAEGRGEGCFFMEDVKESNQVTREEALTGMGIALWSRVNSGLALIERSAVVLSRVHEFLAHWRLLERNLWMVEQTLYALSASERGVGGILPPSYELSFAERARADVVVRHYVGAVRHLFYSEGVGMAGKRILAGGG